MTRGAKTTPDLFSHTACCSHRFSSRELMAVEKHTPKQAMLSIDFLIVGGGIAGLACAVALRRVGHRVLVLEKQERPDEMTGGCRIPPNLSKIFYHWGLREQLQKIAIKSQAIDILRYDSGEFLGTHIWEEEVLRETRGDFCFAHFADLRKLLYDTAISYGAKVRLNSTVAAIDADARTVTLATGEVLRADVIVGADGVSGIARSQLLEGQENFTRGKFNMYCSTVPKKSIMQDPELACFYAQDLTAMFVWFGGDHAVLAFPLGGAPDIAMYVYGPADGCEGSWEDRASLNSMQSLMAQCEPRLRKLSRSASPPVCVPVNDYSELENWVHDSGRMVVIGQAAHPITHGSIQECAMTVEDGAVLAKLFSHLRTEDQIGSFLWAFEDLRQPRCSSVLKKEVGILQYIAMPPGQLQELRERDMRSKRDAGVGALAASDESEELREWVEVKEVFGYDAEDEADNWWVEWGLLRERSKGTDVGFDVQVACAISI